MSRKKPTARIENVFFDVFYEDGSRTSNRKVNGDILGGLEGDAPAQLFLEAQDAEIGERSGRPRPKIKTISRSEK